MHIILPIVASVLLLGWYLRHANRAVHTVPAELEDVVQKPWTDDQVKQALEKAEKSFTDVKPYLLGAKHRRYIVVGGSGFVGGWIVQHLLIRGENPEAIRIVDLSPPKRPEVAKYNIEYIQTDITDSAAVSRAFKAPWKDTVYKLPLTVFHTAAYINPSERKADFTAVYQNININGTRYVVSAAKEAGASVLIATSSGSVGVVPVSYFPMPWESHSKSLVQLAPNAEPKDIDGPLSAFGSCYAWSKAQGESIVRGADDKSSNFRTGSIRPGHAIYGHGLDQFSSVTWDYLRRGGVPSWLQSCVANFVHAQNVSIGHLAYEHTLINDKTFQGEDVGGRAYAVTDPNPPIIYGELYRVLENNSVTPVKFVELAHMSMLLLGYVLEFYHVIRARYVKFLPKVPGDMYYVQPAMFNMCTLHLVYDDSKAKREIGYKPAIETLDGFAEAVVDWNRKAQKSGENEGLNKPLSGFAVPKVPEPNAGR